MLSGSAQFLDAMNQSVRKYKVKLTIKRNDAGATPIDISDRVVSYTFASDFESRSARLDVEFDNYDFSLSPNNRTSNSNVVGGVYNPLFDSNHTVTMYEGLDVGNGAYEYIKKFVGIMGDEIDISSSPTMRISCRDKSKLLQDMYIYQSASYALMLVEEVIQDLLDTFVPDLGIKLQVLNPTQYMIGKPDSPYTAKDTNLWNAIQMLADSATQELRFLEDGTLILRKIERTFANAVPVIALNLDDIASNDMAISDADVRNHIVVKIQGIDPIEKKDDYSISKYGRRYMEVQSSMSKIITDATMAHELAENILSDLRFPFTSSTAEIPLHPLVQVGDIVSIDNDRTGTNPTDDIFKVISIQNTFGVDKRRTSLTLKGIDKFLIDPRIPLNMPTGISGNIQQRTILNYPNSGWTGYEKHTFFPKLEWVSPSTDISGNALTKDFGGYVVYRRCKSVSGGALWSRWGSVASIPSYLPALDLTIDYWYDYSVALEQSKVKADMPVEYQLIAISNKGAKSDKTASYQINVPYEKRYDSSGNVLP